MRYTSEIISFLKSGEIFVFGSNESGVHGAGAARAALEFGAVRGVGFGLQGDTFAIPTKDWNIETLDIQSVRAYIYRFVAFARLRPNLTFLVTKIGCGLAGFTVEEIAGLFRSAGAFDVPNLVMPKEFWEDYRDWQRRSKMPIDKH